MRIDSLPYYENNELKLNCSIYTINSKRDGYENKELIFKSKDNGITWELVNS